MKFPLSMYSAAPTACKNIIKGDKRKSKKREEVRKWERGEGTKRNRPLPARRGLFL